MTANKDLFLLLADTDAQYAIETLLNRPRALGIRPICYDRIRHVGRDAGCRKDCVELLRRYQRSHAHALVVFDRHGSGWDKRPREEIEADRERALADSGWEKRAAVIVLDPELEAWVWSTSPHVAAVLGWKTPETLQAFLQRHRWLETESAKPEQPKEAMEAVLRQARKPRSARIFGELAEKIGLSTCTDPAFAKFRATLQHWFPPP